jgi:hypothetical protein
MTRHSPPTRAEGIAMMATPRAPIDPDILRVVQALARADEAADYAAHQQTNGPAAWKGRPRP